MKANYAPNRQQYATYVRTEFDAHVLFAAVLYEKLLSDADSESIECETVFPHHANECASSMLKQLDKFRNENPEADAKEIALAMLAIHLEYQSDTI